MIQSSQTFSFDPSSDELPRRLGAFLKSHWGAQVQVSELRRFPSGMSWITIGFKAGVQASDGSTHSRSLILRLGDPAGILAPYRAEPEYLALTALANVPGLPIPEAYARSEDPSILGAPFVITQWVPGDTPRPFVGTEPRLNSAAEKSVADDFVDALAAIHTFDWYHSPLAVWASKDQLDVAVRETRHWARHAGVLNADASPVMRYAMRWLEANAPVTERITVVHGDYRVGNFLQQGDRITAILDWELVHLGDPHEDLAWAGLRAYGAGTNRIGGLIDRDVFYQRYEERTGFKVIPSAVRYYEVLGQFKLAAMFVGAVQRVDSGVARDVRMAAIGLNLPPMLMEIHRLIERAQ